MFSLPEPAYAGPDASLDTSIIFNTDRKQRERVRQTERESDRQTYTYFSENKILRN